MEDHATFDLWNIALNLCIVLVLVLLNGFFVAAEFALVKVRQSRLTQLAEEGNSRAKYALKVNRKLDAYLSATQLGITLASLGLGYVAEPAVNHLIIEPILSNMGLHDAAYSSTLSFAITFAIITFLHIVVGELAPKSLAIQKSEVTAMWLSAPLMLFYKIFFPAIWLLNGAANRLLRMVGVEPATEHEAAHTEEEIRILMNQSVKSGHIDKDEMALFDNVFQYSDRLAREVMLPRIDMDCLYTNLSFADNLKLVYQTKHTRYPVAVQDKDQIIGFVHITDLLTADPEEVLDVTDLLRPILTVPESMEISRVMRLMQKHKSQLAIIIDEYGGTAGLLTAEDILEEIVGEIHDEFDGDEREDIEVKDHFTSVDGRMLLEEVNERFHLDIEDDEVDSIGGWMLKMLEGSPEVGRKIEVGSNVLEVAEVDRLKIVRIHIMRADKTVTTSAD